MYKRQGKCSIKEAFIRIEEGEMYIYGMHISPYEKGNKMCIRDRCMTCIAYRPAYALWLLGAEAGILVTAVLCMFLKYRTAGIGMDSMFLKICGGYAGRHYVLLRYNRIQYLETSQNFLAKMCRIEKGELKLLASAAESSQTLPYFRSEHTEQIRKRMLKN